MCFQGVWGSAVQDCRGIMGEEANLVSIETAAESDWINSWLEDRGVAGIRPIPSTCHSIRGLLRLRHLHLNHLRLRHLCAS